MIIQSEQRGPVTLNGVQNTTEFSIKATGKAFKALIDGLYANKAKSIMREICTNAYDAHAAAGKLNVPFRVSLPTRLNPMFSVRDYGVSMDEETIFSLYSTMFDSSKENTNDEVGCFGLGSKSPFAYTDTYSIETFKDRLHTTYTANVNSEGVPQISKMGSLEINHEDEDHDLAVGVRVSFPVNYEDIDKFVRAAREVLPGFDVLPLVSGGMSQGQLEDIADRKVIMVGGNWTMYASEDGYDNGVFVRQGCVIYPVDKKIFSGDEDLAELWGSLDNMATVIDVPIGDVEVALSREALSYVPTTVGNIRRHVRSFVASASGFVSASLEKETSKWRACVARKKLLKDVKGNEYSHNANFLTKLIKQAEWGGAQLGSTLHINTFWYEANVGLYDAKRFENVCPTFKPYSEKYTNPKNLRLTLDPNQDILFAVESSDEEIKHSAKRLGNFVRNGTYDKVVWIKGKNMRECLKVIRSFGHPEFVKISSMEMPTTKIVARNGAALWQWDATCYSELIKVEEIEVNKNTFYVPLKSGAIVDENEDILVAKKDVAGFIRDLTESVDFPDGYKIVFVATSRTDVDVSSIKKAIDFARKKIADVDTDSIVYSRSSRPYNWSDWLKRLVKSDRFDTSLIGDDVLVENINKYSKHYYHKEEAGRVIRVQKVIDTADNRAMVKGLTDRVEQETTEGIRKFKERFPLLDGAGYNLQFDEEGVSDITLYMNAVIAAEKKGTR